jgi:hypothetical protein
MGSNNTEKNYNLCCKIVLFLIFIVVLMFIIKLLTTSKIDNPEPFIPIYEKHAVIEFSDYNSDWNNLCNIIAEKADGVYECIIIESAKEDLLIIANALVFMIDNLSIPIIVTDNIEMGVKLYKNNNMLPYNVMIAANKKLLLATTAQQHGNNFVGKEPETRKIIDPGNMSFNFVNPEIDITVINSSDYIDLIQSCSESDALILNIKDSNHLSENLNQQLKILTDVDIPSILINQLNGDLVIPSYKMNTETAYAKLAVIMSKLEDKNLIEPVFAKNMHNEFL